MYLQLDCRGGAFGKVERAGREDTVFAAGSFYAVLLAAALKYSTLRTPAKLHL